MIEETATVIEIDGEYALLESHRSSACGQCAANKACGTHAMSKVYTSRKVNLRAINTINAKPGDEVVVGLDEHAFLRGTIAVYVIPLILILTSLALGYYAGNGADASDAFGMIGAVFGLAAATVWLRLHARMVKHDKKYQPTVIRPVGSEFLSITS